MNGIEFLSKVNAQEIANGTKFNVYDKEKTVVGIVGVIDTTVVFIDMKVVPTDLYTDKYIFEECE